MYNLSIIIPHFNSAELLNKLLLSIPVRRDIQILVIDDRSNKDMEKLENVKRKFESRVEFYTNNKEKKGAGICRNIGLDYAVGKWILFADADDYFLPEMYSCVSNYFDSDYEIVFFTPTSCNRDTGETTYRHEIYEKYITDYLECPNMNNLLNLKSSTGNPPWSKLIKREFVEMNHIRFSETLHANDIMFSAKIGCYSRKIYATKEKIYCVTLGTQSLTMHMTMEAYDIRLNEYISVCKFLKEYYSKKELVNLHITGIGMLYRAISMHYGIEKYISVILLFRKNGIPIMDKSTLSIKYIFKQVKHRIIMRKQNEKYYIK